MSVSIFQRPACMPLGFHGGCIPTQMHEDRIVSSNIKAALSWIPIIGAILGAVMFAQAYKQHSDCKQNNSFEQGQEDVLKSEMKLGIALMVSLGIIGPIKLVIDMIWTIGRCCTKDSDN